jgi:4-hydroxybenzoyl-CoA thioesterase/acyl-CoA thioester hydrolase
LTDTPAPVSEHRLTRRVQFHETDAAGLVHFSAFFRYMEEGEHALWRAAGLSIHPAGTEVGWPRLSASFEYHRPLRFEDEFEIRMQVAAVDRSTISYVCRLTRGDEAIATGRLKIICVSRRPDAPLKAISIPPDIAARFRAVPEEQEER